MSLRVGEHPGDLYFIRPDGSPVSISAFLGRPLVLIFLRHLG
jgi:hypothetical protein